jgi:hypothetical protein
MVTTSLAEPTPADKSAKVSSRFAAYFSGCDPHELLLPGTRVALLCQESWLQRLFLRLDLADVAALRLASKHHRALVTPELLSLVLLTGREKPAQRAFQLGEEMVEWLCAIAFRPRLARFAVPRLQNALIAVSRAVIGELEDLDKSIQDAQIEVDDKLSRVFASLQSGSRPGSRPVSVDPALRQRDVDPADRLLSILIKPARSPSLLQTFLSDRLSKNPDVISFTSVLLWGFCRQECWRSMSALLSGCRAEPPLWQLIHINPSTEYWMSCQVIERNAPLEVLGGISAVFKEVQQTYLLFAASIFGNLDALRYLVACRELNIDVYDPSMKGNHTPLLLSVMRGCLESVKILIGKGADPNKGWNERQESALFYACSAVNPALDMPDESSDPTQYPLATEDPRFLGKVVHVDGSLYVKVGFPPLVDEEGDIIATDVSNTEYKHTAPFAETQHAKRLTLSLVQPIAFDPRLLFAPPRMIVRFRLSGPPEAFSSTFQGPSLPVKVMPFDGDSNLLRKIDEAEPAFYLRESPKDSAADQRWRETRYCQTQHCQGLDSSWSVRGSRQHGRDDGSARRAGVWSQEWAHYPHAH